jgi:dihydrofolate reductase
LLAHGLVDEYRLAIAPVLMGRGTPLFKPMNTAARLELKSAKPVRNGGVLLMYSIRSA